jgi:hypothetical protein
LLTEDLPHAVLPHTLSEIEVFNPMSPGWEKKKRLRKKEEEERMKK